MYRFFNGFNSIIHHVKLKSNFFRSSFKYSLGDDFIWPVYFLCHPSFSVAFKFLGFQLKPIAFNRPTLSGSIVVFEPMACDRYCFLWFFIQFDRDESWKFEGTLACPYVNWNTSRDWYRSCHCALWESHINPAFVNISCLSSLKVECKPRSLRFRWCLCFRIHWLSCTWYII